MKSLNKKGQLNSMGPAVIALVIAGTFLIMGLIILQEMRDTDVISQANTNSITNETLTTVDENGETLVSGPGATCSITIITNQTDGVTINTGNYTQTNCLISYAGVGLFNNTNWNVTYTYTSGDEAYLSGNETLVGLGTFADFWEIIVLAIVITIVIGLLLVVFGGRRAR